MNPKILRYVFTALFAAIISVGCVIAIPLPGGVPITVQDMLSIMAGTILGSFFGGVSVIIWMTLGAVGIPVFVNARGGLAIILGPTGGYMIGYALGSLAAGFLLGTPRPDESKKDPRNLIRITVISLLAYSLIYLTEIPWFMRVMASKGTPETFRTVLRLTFVPFFPCALLKWLVTIPLTAVLRPVAARYLFSAASEKDEREVLERLKAES